MNEQEHKTLRVGVVAVAALLAWVAFVGKSCNVARYEASVQVVEKTGCPPWDLERNN